MAERLAAQSSDTGDALSELWRSGLQFVPRALAFMAIMVAGYLVAKVVHRMVDQGLRRVGFDRAIERGGIGRTLERSRYDASDICAKLIYYAVLLLSLQLAFGIWGANPISELISAVVRWLPRAFVAIVIVVVAGAIANAVRDLVRGALGGLSYGRLLATIAWAFLLGLGIIAALNQVGIATTVTTPVLVAALATVSGILIVGIGGGLVRPMQRRWEVWLDQMAAESLVIRERAQAYADSREDIRRQAADAAGIRPPMAAGGPGAGDGPGEAVDGGWFASATDSADPSPVADGVHRPPVAYGPDGPAILADVAGPGGSPAESSTDGDVVTSGERTPAADLERFPAR